MSESLQAALTGAAEATLENMCFTTPLGTADGFNEEGAICAAVRFTGELSGAMWLSATREAAALLAASFLGVPEEELERNQTEAVVSELANIICGCALSAHRPAGHFSLTVGDFVRRGGTAATREALCRYELEAGVLQIGITEE
jgi:CheY-specific phosphatase CheX